MDISANPYPSPRGALVVGVATMGVAAVLPLTIGSPSWGGRREEAGGRARLWLCWSVGGTGLCLFPASVAVGEARTGGPCRPPCRVGRRPASASAPAAWGGPCRASWRRGAGRWEQSARAPSLENYNNCSGRNTTTSQHSSALYPLISSTT